MRLQVREMPYLDIGRSGFRLSLKLKLHEDWGTTPQAIDYCLGVADDLDVQVMITDTLKKVLLNELSIP